MVGACGFLVIPCGGYDGGDYGEGSGLEVETIERKLLRVGGRGLGGLNDLPRGTTDNSKRGGFARLRCPCGACRPRSVMEIRSNDGRH
ncbi:hypothetical protein M5K25_016670 [Dendrobium thyrsiflorum]|uniref:Uncharacterized protein n=1 Tax=Dendrobium thyrsiflorum TaxID=117978 RepID=A0ABD0USI1_DENTH